MRETIIFVAKRENGEVLGSVETIVLGYRHALPASVYEQLKRLWLTTIGHDLAGVEPYPTDEKQRIGNETEGYFDVKLWRVSRGCGAEVYRVMNVDGQDKTDTENAVLSFTTVLPREKVKREK